jgi:hypothetical protein
MSVVKSALFFPAPPSLNTKWWHRLATALFWLWSLICVLVVAVFGALMLRAVAAINDPDVGQLSGDAGDPSYCLMVMVTWSVLLFLPGVIYRIFLFITRGDSWKEASSEAAQGEHGTRKPGEVRIIRGENLRSYSVADELSKWAKLRDEGVVSEEEFQDARSKILRSE